MGADYLISVRDREPIKWWLAISGVEGRCEMKGCAKVAQVPLDFYKPSAMVAWVALLCRAHAGVVVEHPSEFGLLWGPGGRPAVLGVKQLAVELAKADK